MEAEPETAARGTTPSGAWRLDLALFAVSACVLTLQVLQTKIFAFSLDPLTIYLAIGVCMLGLGASATLLASFPAPDPERVPGLVAAAANAGAVTLVLAHAVFAAFGASLGQGAGASILVLICLTVPYLCFGLAIALVLVARRQEIGRAYAANLAGDAPGSAGGAVTRCSPPATRAPPSSPADAGARRSGPLPRRRGSGRRPPGA